MKNITPSIRDLLQSYHNHTDKENWHKYGMFYELLITALYNEKERAIRILEIGVGRGAAMVAFMEVPYVGKYVGVDIFHNLRFDIPDNCDFILADAYTNKTVQTIKEKHGTFDLVIDDGSHKLDAFHFFFENYVSVIEDGFMVYEDMNPQWKTSEEIKIDLEGIVFLDHRLSSHPPPRENLRLDSILACKKIRK